MAVKKEMATHNRVLAFAAYFIGLHYFVVVFLLLSSAVMLWNVTKQRKMPSVPDENASHGSLLVNVKKQLSIYESGCLQAEVNYHSQQHKRRHRMCLLTHSSWQVATVYWSPRPCQAPCLSSYIGCLWSWLSCGNSVWKSVIWLHKITIPVCFGF